MKKKVLREFTSIVGETLISVGCMGVVVFGWRVIERAYNML